LIDSPWNIFFKAVQRNTQVNYVGIDHHRQYSLTLSPFFGPFRGFLKWIESLPVVTILSTLKAENHCAARVKANPGISLMRDLDLKRETMAPGEENIRLFNGRAGHSQDPLGEMGPLAPAASSHLAGLGRGCGVIAQALHLGPF
jgi:hypothetical protein